MTARAIEHARERQFELRASTIEAWLLAAAALAAALAATTLAPKLAVPLLLGGLWSAYAGGRALVHRQLLLEDLAADAEAHAIPEVRRIALRATALERRRRVAEWIRAALDSSSGRVGRVEANRSELEELEQALLDERLEVDPAAAVTLERLTQGGVAFYGSTPPTDELRSRLRRIQAGFHRPADSA